MTPEQRRAMWRLPGADQAAALGLVPIIMQPPADQPPDARLAYAVAENARLWASQAPAEEAPDTPEVVTPQPQPQVPSDDGFVPWTEVLRPTDNTPPADVRYGDAGDAGSYLPPTYTSYQIYYGGCYPYYYGYPSAWPLVVYAPYSSYGYCYTGDYLRCGARGHVYYHDSRPRLSFGIGGGRGHYDHRRWTSPATSDHRRDGQRSDGQHDASGRRFYWGQRGSSGGRSGGVADGGSVRGGRSGWGTRDEPRPTIRRPSSTDVRSGDRTGASGHGRSTSGRGTSVRPDTRDTRATRPPAVRSSSGGRSGGFPTVRPSAPARPSTPRSTPPARGTSPRGGRRP